MKLKLVKTEQVTLRFEALIMYFNFKKDFGTRKIDIFLGHKTYLERTEDAQDVFWTSRVRSIYVLCPGRYRDLHKLLKHCEGIALKCCVYYLAILIQSINFYSPWNHQKTINGLVISGNKKLMNLLKFT